MLTIRPQEKVRRHLHGGTGVLYPSATELAHGSAFGQWPVLIYIVANPYLHRAFYLPVVAPACSLSESHIHPPDTRESEDLVTLNKGSFSG